MCSVRESSNPRPGRRREAIIAAAGKVFHAHGYAAATMEAVAAEAGVAKGSLYNYFKSKQELFTQLFAEVISGDEAEVERLVAEPIPADEKLQKLLENVFTQLARYTAIGGLVLEFWATAARQQHSGELSAMLEQMFSHSRKRIAAIVSQGVKAGQFRSEIDPDVAASLILAVVNGIVVVSILEVGVDFGPHSLTALKRGLTGALTAWAETEVSDDKQENSSGEKI